MVVRPIAAAYAMGETGRSINANGGQGGPAVFSTNDTISLNGGKSARAGLYSASPIFKIMGAVELMSESCGVYDDMAAPVTNR